MIPTATVSDRLNVPRRNCRRMRRAIKSFVKHGGKSLARKPWYYAGESGVRYFRWLYNGSI